MAVKWISSWLCLPFCRVGLWIHSLSGGFLVSHTSTKASKDASQGRSLENKNQQEAVEMINYGGECWKGGGGASFSCHLSIVPGCHSFSEQIYWGSESRTLVPLVSLLHRDVISTPPLQIDGIDFSRAIHPSAALGWGRQVRSLRMAIRSGRCADENRTGGKELTPELTFSPGCLLLTLNSSLTLTENVSHTTLRPNHHCMTV